MVTKFLSRKSKTEHYALNPFSQKFSQFLSGKSQNGQIFLSIFKKFTLKFENMKNTMRLTL